MGTKKPKRDFSQPISGTALGQIPHLDQQIFKEVLDLITEYDTDNSSLLLLSVNLLMKASEVVAIGQAFRKAGNELHNAKNAFINSIESMPEQDDPHPDPVLGIVLTEDNFPPKRKNSLLTTEAED